MKVRGAVSDPSKTTAHGVSLAAGLGLTLEACR